jgi:hypothetical protein
MARRRPHPHPMMRPANVERAFYGTLLVGMIAAVILLFVFLFRLVDAVHKI